MMNGDLSPRAPRRVLTALAVVAGLSSAAAPSVSSAESLSGVFLAARHAEAAGDIDAAARYFRRAVAYAPTENNLIVSAALYSTLAGQFDTAASLSKRLVVVAPGNRIGAMVGVVDAMREGRYGEAADLLESYGAGASEVERAVTKAWIAAGAGDFEAARAALADQTEPAIVRMLGEYHTGLLYALEGDHLAAVDAFYAARETGGGWGTRLTLALIASLERSGQGSAAEALIAQELESSPFNPLLLQARETRELGEPAPLMATSATDGLAEALHGFGAAIADGRRESARRALFYARLVLALRPGFEEGLLLAGDLLNSIDQFESAAATFGLVPDASPLAETAIIGQASALEESGDRDAAIEILAALSARDDARPRIHFNKAEMLSSAERYDECVAAYTDGISRLPALEERHWVSFFGLGICNERLGQWPAAETAFEQALALRPEQPDVLNYLGYSLIEMGERYEEARDMIERAVAQRPQSGYIVDSLGWVLYRMGDFEGAVRELERAVALTPTESVINDHLGDALWRVGRKREAEFQWKRALSFEPETEDERARILRKLDVGLDVVLEEESSEAAGDAPDAPGDKADGEEATPTVTDRQGG